MRATLKGEKKSSHPDFRIYSVCTKYKGSMTHPSRTLIFIAKFLALTSIDFNHSCD